ncbi:hypothetical protein QWY77_03935 [Thalassotalea ponticola]|uniref:hypothetical protein n=1 Tax=Thalassotalea ponticola TaxID=1523392 RepID=UPI0025B5FD50|nr:hypothetical protein [Thalassotalea ponticola]MDN3651916.1 hypothetical protein [Thalassotalea ponticola]
MKIRHTVVAIGTFAMALFASTGNAKDQQSATSEAVQCGIVSVNKPTPTTKDLYPAKVNTIDDDPVKSNSHTFFLPVGKHKIKVMENIHDDLFTRRRSGMLNYKIIEVDVKANTQYYLAAKFNRKQKTDLKSGGYWEPVVWKTMARECSN